MTKLSVIWSLIAAVIVGGAALTTGYFYKESQQKTAEAPATSGMEQTQTASREDTATPEASAPDAADKGAQKPASPDLKAAMDKLTFDVVGVEPTGETVVAGRAQAGAKVALTANGEIVGTAIASEKGEWTIILDKPLKPGDFDIALQELDASGNAKVESAQRVAVSVPSDGKSKPLVVLNTPDAPSNVLQMPEPVEVASAEKPAKEAKPAEETMAAAEPTAPADPAETEVAAATPAPTEEPAKETVVATAEPEAPKAAEAPAAAEPQAAAQTDAKSEAPVATAEAPAAPAEQPVAEETTPAAGAEPAKETEVAATTPAEQPAAEAPAETLVATVEAVESENGKIYVAGTGKEGLKVRVYVAGELLGEAVVGENGRWLLEAEKQLAPGNVEVRADLIGDDKGTVVARAAVTFDKAPEKIILSKVEAAGETATDASGNQVAVTKALPTVIIRKGDNLWNISRRLYGTGYRYTTIYRANKRQIRNPDLIYPGQVFLTPEGDLNWKPVPN